MSIQPIPELLVRPERPAKKGWILRAAAFLFAAGAAAIWLGVVLLPKPWWIGSGFASDPGYFIRKNTIAYPICAPWTAKPQTDALGMQHVSWLFTNAALAPGKQADMALLLPRGSEIMRVDCGTGTALRECSLRKGCEPPVTVMLDDDVYTRGRAIEISVVNKSPAKTAIVGFRVVWRDQAATVAKR